MIQWKCREAVDPLLRGRFTSATLGALLSAILASSLLGHPAWANESSAAPKSPYGFSSGSQSDVQTRSAGEPTSLPKIVDRAWSWLLYEQHRFTQHMTGAVRDLKSTTNVASTTGALVLASVIYGIFHAVGPGHGKAVISSYMLADKQTLRRGVFLAFISSLIQALSAITLIGGLYLAAKATGLQTRFAEASLETLSWGCVAALGAWLSIKQILPIFARRHPPASAKTRADYACDQKGQTRHGCLHHGHVHAHLTDHASDCGCTVPSVIEDHHVHDEHCGHIHVAGPQQLGGGLSWQKALTLAFSVGIRPCTGALLVIVFATAQGALWAGVLATFAMSLGTAITVSALAALTVGSRNLAISLAGAESRWCGMIARGASIASSATVFVLGTAFFFASMHAMRPF
jgi:nickel/cobalt transporter (NicO) family protein